MPNESSRSEKENLIYEISFIFDHKLDEQQAKEKLDSLRTFITSQGGSLISEEAPHKRELAYEMTRIQNNKNIKFQEGYFGWVKFEMSPEGVLDLHKELKLDEEIVRYLIIKAEKGNDVLIRDQIVIKADSSTARFANEAIPEGGGVEEDVNIDTTRETSGELRDFPLAAEIENRPLEILEGKGK